MNSEWQNFLVSQGAVIGDDGQVAFPAAAPGDCELVDLSHLGLIAITGADADSFLQGQLTNDLRELTEQHSQMGSHCSPKGRMLANFRLLRRPGVIYLQLPAEMLPDLLKRLGMFKLRAQVELRDAGEQLLAIGLAGAGAAELLGSELGPVPELEAGVTQHQDLTLLRMPGSNPRFQVLGPPGQLIGLWVRLSARGAVPSSADHWALLDIRAGIPTLYRETVDAFVPQMANMQLVDGVSFTKGCYIGQEVVSRLQYLGKLKRRMFRAEVVSPSCPHPGDELFSDTSESGQGAGRVVDARSLGDGRHELLAVVEISAAEQDQVRLGVDGPLLHFLDLPYAYYPA
jgi:hypothetical protein